MLLTLKAKVNSEAERQFQEMNCLQHDVGVAFELEKSVYFGPEPKREQTKKQMLDWAKNVYGCLH